MIACSIAGTGSYLPARIVTNDDLVARLDVPDIDASWIQERTGIKTRYWCGADEATSDLALHASQAALIDASIGAGDVDLVIVATSTPDWPQPPTASRVHGMLGMRSDTAAFDVNGVCSGWIQALIIAASSLSAHAAWNHVLVVGADTYSRITNPRDHRTRILFGDGAGAVILSRSDEGDAGILATHTFTSFAGHEALQVPAGGSREPIDIASLEAGRNYFSMDGRAVRAFGVREMDRALKKLCAAIGGHKPNHVILHQSNLRMLEAACDAAGIEHDRMITTIERAGNTAAASIPLTLDAARRARALRRGDMLGMVGYGGGLSAAGVLMRV